MAEPQTALAVGNMAEIANTSTDDSRKISLPMDRQPDQSAGGGKAPPLHDEARKKEEEKAEWERKLEAEKKAAEMKAEWEREIEEKKRKSAIEFQVLSMEMARRAAREKLEWERRIEEEKRKALIEFEQTQREATRMAAEAKAAWEKKMEEEKKKALMEYEEAQRKSSRAAEEAARKAAEEKAAWEIKIEQEKKKALFEFEQAQREALRATEEAALKAAAEKEAWKLKIEQEKKKALFEFEQAQRKAAAVVKFKDAVGRKFSFPFPLVQTREGMEELIKNAFQYVEGFTERVNRGHYDLLDPDGKIIPRKNWEAIIKPDWSITMDMWLFDPLTDRPSSVLLPPPLSPPSNIPEESHGKPIKTDKAIVFSFPRDTTADSGGSLYLVQFPFNFNDFVINKEIIISCELSSPIDGHKTEVEIMKIGLFRPSQPGAGLEQVLDSRNGAVEPEGSFKFIVRTREKHSFALLVRGPSSEAAVSFSVAFDVRSADDVARWDSHPTEVPAVINMIDKTTWTPFSWAAMHGWVDALKLLIQEAGATADKLDNEGRTPLSWAAEKGQLEVVRILLKARANCNYQTSEKQDTPLILAVRGGHEGVVEALLRGGADATPPKAKELAKPFSKIWDMITAFAADSRLYKTENYVHDDVDCKFPVTVANFNFVVESGVLRLAPQIFEPANVKELLADPWCFLNTKGAAAPSFRWLHLPANNMRWVERLMTNFYDNPGLVDTVLASERWMEQQHPGAPNVHHAQFMLPYCQTFLGPPPYSAQEKGPPKGTHQRKDLVLFMPFLHWDLVETWKKREKVVRALSSSTLHDPGDDRDARLLKAYRGINHPLHIRRTLYQYYYSTVDDTFTLDEEQVIMRYLVESEAAPKGAPKAITMVDQLWLWVLNGVNGKPATVVTCFPQPDSGPKGLVDLLAHINDSLSKTSLSIQTAYDLAELIATTCSGLYLNPGNKLSFGSGPTIMQLFDFYEAELTRRAQKEAQLFSDFVGLDEKKVTDIDTEIKTLSRTKKLVGELNIVLKLFQDQKKALDCMNKMLKSIHKPGRDRKFSGDGSENPLLAKSDQEDEKTQLPREEPGGRKDQPHNTTEEVDRTTDEDPPSYNPDDFFRPVEMVGPRIGEINSVIKQVEGMIQRAEKLEKDLHTLLDLKNKHNSVADAKESVKQGRTVLVFTLTTIIFLPLSFLASFLALNISEYKTNSNGKLNLGYVSYIMFPVSALVSAVLISTALQIDRISELWKKVSDRWKSKGSSDLEAQIKTD